MSQAVLPISAIVPTRNRSQALCRMLTSLAKQSRQPAEMIIVDASTSGETEQISQKSVTGLETRIIYERARKIGAAAQRNQAMDHCSQKANLLLDDDIIFEPECIERLWDALQSDTRLGGVNAMIVNQRYSTPGRVSRTVFRLLSGTNHDSYAGKCIGPALNLLPEDDPDLPFVVPVEWLNTTCTLYRREALPEPLFASQFTGYSLMEDLALSLAIGKKWKLANARTARIYHDSQPADYKDNKFALAKMELINRHYVMTQILERRQLSDYLKLFLLELFGIATSLAKLTEWNTLPAVLFGKVAAVGTIITAKTPA
jgi:GT2 family glycosyltransferase